ncbi:TPA: metal ABC transporter permease [Candidatus Poribacteria bacterium]|nr:metal ABC transporter permease [Candidatus Poribacteria bacterium]HEX28695.1 metal ABC transporter permease [Candidatus Poribacteria bacterium]
MNLPEMLQYGFMQRALMAGVIVGALTAAIGTYVVLRGMAFLGAGISHAAFGGVALGYYLGLNPSAVAIIFCVLVSWAIAVTGRLTRLKSDVPIGVFFAATMSFGAIIINLIKEYNVDLFGYLFGNILAVSKVDLIITASLGVILMFLILIFYHQFLYITFDSQMARVSGIPVVAMDMLLLSMISVAIVISIKVVGIILVSALLVAPSATVMGWVRNFKALMAFSILVGVLSSLGGIVISYYLNTPSGATIVLLLTLTFLTSSILLKIKKG